VASAHLSGVDLPADWVETLGKVARGEVTADDAVRSVVYSELHYAIKMAVAKCWGYRTWTEVAAIEDGQASSMLATTEAVLAVVAPLLAAKDRKLVLAEAALEPGRQALADLVDTWRLLRQRNREYGRASATIGQLRAELARKASERAEALKALADAGDVVGAQRAEINQLRTERDDAREYVERLVLAARGDWPSWGDDVPAAFMEAERHIDGLRARPTVHAYEAACEALEKRRVALANAIQYETASFYDAVDEVQAMRAELDAVKTDAIVLPDDVVKQIASVLADWRPGDSPRFHAANVAYLARSWRGQPNTEATEQAHDAALVAIAEARQAVDSGERYSLEEVIAEQAPREPRVWRKGDEPPPLDVKKVRHDNSQVFTRVGSNGWRAGIGRVLTGEQLIDQLGGYKLTEVIEDGTQ
jgi:hypothetical protein